MLSLIAGLWLAPPALADDVTVAVARMPLPAGKKLDWDDLSTIKLPDALVPPTAVVLGADLVGKTLALPVAVQSPIVAQRLVGVEVPVVAPPVDAMPAVAEVEVAREMGVVAALVQAGDTVGFVRTDKGTPCVLAWAEVVKRGSPVTVRVPAVHGPDLASAHEPAVLLKGPDTHRPDLPLCTPLPLPDAVDAVDAAERKEVSP